MANIPIYSNNGQSRNTSFIGIDPKLPLCPVQKLDHANISLRKYHRYAANIYSLAWEHHLNGLLKEEEQLKALASHSPFNFHTNYLEQLVSLYQKEVHSSASNVQSLAKILAEQFLTQQIMAAEKLKEKRVKLRARINSTIQQTTNKKNEIALKWKFDIKRLFHQMREVIEHILDAEGERQFQRLQYLIDQKRNLTSEYLKELPKKTTAQILEYLSQIRLMLSKKTDEIMVLKEIHGQDFVYDDMTVKDISASYKSGDDSASVLSSRLSISRSQSQKKKRKEEEKKIEKYFNLDQLKKKLKVTDVNQIKAAVRRIMVKETLAEAEHVKAKQYRKEAEQIQKIKDSSPTMKKLYERKEREAKASLQKKEKQQRPYSAPLKSRVFYLQLISVKQIRERVNFRGEKIGFNQSREEMNLLQSSFQRDYTLNNTVGECFNAATRYNKLFQQI